LKIRPKNLNDKNFHAAILPVTSKKASPEMLAKHWNLGKSCYVSKTGISSCIEAPSVQLEGCQLHISLGL
jgi:hypothetical protein